MNDPEKKVLHEMQHIQRTLDDLLHGIAGERMGYVLLVVPFHRPGDHIYSTNISDIGVVPTYLRQAAQAVDAQENTSPDRITH